jgi:hypothetical protein
VDTQDVIGRAELATVADHLRALLVELNDPANELTATAATRRRIEGAALGLAALAASTV